jgi:hypothetical protein
MNELLIHSAKELTDDETAGGHGDQWGVFDDDAPALIGRWLDVAVQKSEPAAFGVAGIEAIRPLVAAGEPAGAALLYTGCDLGVSRNGLMSLIHFDPGGPNQKPENRLISAFPFFGNGTKVDAQVEGIGLFPNRLEAWLRLGLVVGAMIKAFDPLFWQNRALYREGEYYRFSVAALAHWMEAAPEIEHVIDDEQEIRQFHARNQWAGTHGHWSREDEEASMALWASASPEDLEPIHIDLTKMAVLMPTDSGSEDDAYYQGEVVRIEPHAVRMLDVDFWRVDTVVMRPDEDFVLPIYVAERVFENGWRPQVGQYVSGVLWLQAHVAGTEARAVSE